MGSGIAQRSAIGTVRRVLLGDEIVNNVPIIIGSSLTGLLVSLSLSREGIEHVLIGGPRPARMPRLGESANEGACLALWDLLGPEFRQYYHRKRHVSFSWGELTGMIAVSNPTIGVDDVDDRAPGTLGFLDIGPRLVHVDRAELDPAVYDAALGKPQCHFIEGRVEHIGFDRARDSVEDIVMEDGQRLAPSHVFDASGYQGLLSAAARLENRPLSRLQRVVWHHRINDVVGADRTSDRAWWQFGTNVVRLDQRGDGVDGVAWLIPLGNRVSIGLSVDAERESLVSDVVLVELLEAALARRGMPVREHFPRAREHQTLTHRYYMRERAYGSNWMLAGPSFGQVWFPSSAGLSTSTMAAYMAPAFIERPKEVGARYERRFRELLGFHELLDAVISRPPPTRVHQMYDFWAKWLLGVLERVPHDLAIASGDERPRLPMLRALASVIGRSTQTLLGGMGFLRIRVERATTPQQWQRVYADYSKPTRFLMANLVRGWLQYSRSLLAAAWGRRSRAAGAIAALDRSHSAATSQHSVPTLPF